MSGRTRLYIAGKFTSQERLRLVRDEAQALGFVVTSTWLDETATDYSASIAYKIECAERDLLKVLRSEVLLVDTFDVSDTGGREVEFGSVLGISGYRIAIVGPPRNIFHYLVPGFGDWKEALQWALKATD